MPNFIEHIGFDEFINREKDITGLVGYAIENGKPVIGYYGHPYINYHDGDAQFIIRTRINQENKKIEVVGFDTHGDGNSVWKVRLHEINIDDSDDPTSKRVCVTREDGSGLTVINIVNADVLPSFAKDEIYSLQMIAFPIDIKYYESSDDYEEDEKLNVDGKNWLLGEGTVFPLGFMSNHMLSEDGDIDEIKKIDPKQDDVVVVRGVVKSLYYGVLQNGEEKVRAYIRCIVETAYGDLEIDHGFNAVDEEQRKNIKIGSTVVAMVVLSGDAAIYEYSDGFVKDEEHNLRLLRYTFINGDPERLRLVLSEDAEYYSDSNGKNYKGKEEIISRIKYVQENGKHKYYAHMAKITSVDDNGASDLIYPVGTKCVILASEDSNNFESIAFVTTNSQGYITKIHTSMDSNYHFKVEELPNISDDIKIPESYQERMILRARYHGFHDCSTDEMLEKVHVSSRDEEVIKMFISEKLLCKGPIKPEIAENIFGYIFAKGIEDNAFPVMNHVPSFENCFNASDGIFDAKAGGKLKEKLEYAMNKGKQFLKDYNDISDSKDIFIDEIAEALKYVYALAKECAQSYLKELEEN